jgi:hypothetical protein
MYQRLISNYIYRSDPGPKLLKPIDTYEDVQDGLDGLDTITAEGFEKKIVSKRKRKLSESGVASAGKEQEISDSHVIKKRVGRFSAPSAASLDVGDDSGNESDSETGYKAPPGMIFQPMCSACDESTDGE